MKTAKEIFRKMRYRRGFSLRAVAEKTKIPLKYLRGIERGDSGSFPDFHYAQLYVRDYAQFLGLSAQKMVSLFRRDWQGDWKPDRMGNKKPPFNLINQLPFGVGGGLIVLLLILAVGGYLLYQYLAFNSPPPLEVKVSCLPNKILVAGKTKSGAIIRIDGETVLLSSKGEFKKEIVSPWPEKIDVEAESPAGKVRKEAIKVRCH